MHIEYIRENPELVRQALKNRNEQDVDLDRIIQLDKRRREAIAEADSLKNKRNVVSKKIGELKKKGQNADELIQEMREVGSRIKKLDEEIAQMEAELEDRLLRVPNLPAPDVPVGPDESYNVEVRKVGRPPEFDFEPKPHWDIAAHLDILDFETAAKITGARFVVNKGLGAALERALINFMLDLHVTEHGYMEIFPPLIVHERSLVATGQLPKFKDTVFKLENRDFYLNPTAEVPVTNIHRDSILDEEDLPLYYVAYAPSFRNEAFSHGRDTRGLIRMYQFNKVELVKFTKPEDSFRELENMVSEAGKVLERLGLAYRVVEMCTGDLGISAAKKYDLEVWMPSYGEYVEVSSCSNCTDFQARRAMIRYRTREGKLEYCHTLNGSGVAVGRTVAAILENYQQKDGSVIIPEALQPYMKGISRIG